MHPHAVLTSMDFSAIGSKCTQEHQTNRQGCHHIQSSSIAKSAASVNDWRQEHTQRDDKRLETSYCDDPVSLDYPA